MSSVKDFFTKVDGDPTLQKKYDSLDNRQAVMTFAKELGYNFTEAEFVSHFQGGINLDNISGGIAQNVDGPVMVSRPCPCLP